MRANRLRLNALGAWLGLAALAFNALVPVHLAFSLAVDANRSAQCGQHPDFETSRSNAEWRLLALVTGQINGSDHDPRHGAHPPAPCAVCGAIANFAGFVPAAGAVLPLPIRLDQVHTPLPLAEIRPEQTPLFRYWSRAPPRQAVFAT